MNRKADLPMEGLQQIVNIKASINKGLSPELRQAFPNVKPVQRPTVQFTRIPDTAWVTGFANAEGCFFIGTMKSSPYLFDHKKVKQVQLVGGAP